MNPKQEKDDEFERYDESNELRRLTRSLELSEKYYLFFACCNQVPKQNELIKQIKQSLPAKKIEVVKLQQPTINLLNELREILNADKPDAVFVQGFERSISSDEDADNLAVVNLNHLRDSFRGFLACPLILWLPEYAIVKITNTAPDFFSVRSGTFYFSSTPEKLTEQIFQSISNQFDEVASLLLAEKLKRVQTLEKLLAEYESLPMNKRDEFAEARLNGSLANISLSVSNYRKAIGLYIKALQIHQKLKDRQGEGAILCNLGTAYMNLGEYQNAIESSEQALGISREIGDVQTEGSALSNIGAVYANLGEYLKAVDFFEMSLTISREIHDLQGESICLGNLGNAYDSLSEHSKAIEYYNQALQIEREVGDKQGEALNSGNLGLAYRKLGDYQKAIEFYNRALTISSETGDRQVQGASLFNLGATHLYMNEVQKACESWREALVILELIESPSADLVQQSLNNFCKS